MSRKFYTLLLLAFLCVSAEAQTTGKLDLRLFKRLSEGNFHKENMRLLVRGDMDQIEKLTNKMGGTYKYGYNQVSSVEVPEKNLIAFSQSKAVEKIESTGGRGTFLMDTARIRNNIDSVQAGFAPLVHGLKGKNVVMGIIDGGIYWQHLDFKNPADSTTRIKYIWDQIVSGGNVPAPYNFGRQWTAADINAGTCTHTPLASDNGHGTCVAGIAAGNGLSNVGTPFQGLYTGVAPETDIIIVRIDYDNFATGVADAVDYIFKKADSLGKPCVINTSLGDYYGSHDGDDLTSHLLSGLIAQKNGRVLVAAAGNAGQVPYHLSYPIPADSAYTYFNYNPAFGDIYFDWWTNVADFQNAYFAIGCNAPSGADSGRTAYFNIPANFPTLTPLNTIYPSYELYSNHNVHMGTVNMAITLDDNRYHVEVDITPIGTSNTWRLQTHGSGTFDLWADPNLTTSSSMVYNPTDPTYRNADFSKNMVSSWQNSDTVITVGNYSNRASYVDVYGNTINLLQSPYYETVGQLFGTSSHGPTRDNRIKPDVVATGSTTICTGDANYINTLIANSQGSKVAVTGKDVRNGGTSMASPIVAGIAALYLEKYPNASWSEIKQALICTAKHDGFTGSTPNFGYGYGKVDGFAAIAHSCIRYGSHDTACANYDSLSNTDTGCVAKVYGIMDTACVNYNPLATVNSGICIQKIYGIMDTACMNYNPLANVSGGVCVPKVYGIMDTACLNYNPLANVSGGVCTPKVYGVMDTACMNYNPLANISGGVCVPKVYGIMDTACLNYNPLANVSGGVCTPKVYGVMDTACMNYNALANVSGGVCTPKVYGIMDTACMNYNPLATVSGGVCVPKVYGIMDTACVNYNPLANVSGGVCTPKVYGVMDTACMNYNPLANVSGGVCVPKVYGIMDTACLNYNPLANVSGGVCTSKVYGVTDTACMNYNPLANESGGVCVPKVYGIMDTACINYNPLANVSGGVCAPKVYGVMDTACMNYNPNANVSGGVCTAKIYGIMDTACMNYNPNANVSGGACVAKVYGVMDTACVNYNPNANVNGGVCVAKVYGVTDTSCINYNAAANVDNGACSAKIYGVMDTSCVNYNPNANVGGGSCVAKVYGATDSTCANYNALANIDNGSCISGISTIGADKVTVQVIPNPFSSQTMFVIDGLQFVKGGIKIYNQLGALVDEINLTNGKTQYIYRNDKLAKAIYNYILQADGKNVKAGKLVVE